MPPDITAARFGISVDGQQIGAFSDLAGITTEVETVDYMSSGDESVFLNRFAGLRKRISVRLVRPRGATTSIRTWHEAAKVNPGRVSKKVTLSLHDADKPAARYALENAWPSNIEIGGLKGDASTSTMETVTMTCEFIQRVSV